MPLLETEFKNQSQKKTQLPCQLHAIESTVCTPRQNRMPLSLLRILAEPMGVVYSWDDYFAKHLEWSLQYLPFRDYSVILQPYQSHPEAARGRFLHRITAPSFDQTTLTSWTDLHLQFNGYQISQCDGFTLAHNIGIKGLYQSQFYRGGRSAHLGLLYLQILSIRSLMRTYLKPHLPVWASRLYNKRRSEDDR